MGTKKAPKQKASAPKSSTKAPAPASPSSKAASKAASTKASPSSKASSQASSTVAAALAARLSRLPRVREVKQPEPGGIAVRVRTKQIELPLLVHVGDDDVDVVAFDLYPFRFVGVDADAVSWPPLLRLARASHVQIGLDDDFEDDAVLVYSLSVPRGFLADDATVARVVETLCGFAEDHYDAVMKATGLVELG